MSSEAPNEKKPGRGGIGGWTSNRGLIASISMAFFGAIFILIIIVGAGSYVSMITSPPETLQTPAASPIESNALSVSTDKGSYGFGDTVQVSGTVDQPTKGKTVRLDVYDPEGRIFNSYVFDPSNLTSTLAPDKPQSGIQVSPDEEGTFSYTFPLSVISPEEGTKGNYTVDATYGKLTKNATFTVG